MIRTAASSRASRTPEDRAQSRTLREFSWSPQSAPAFWRAVALRRYFLVNMLINIYLSLFNKKSLTNGINRLILCAMTANEISPKANARLNRIQRISKCIRLFIQYGCPLIVLGWVVIIILVSKGMIALPKPPLPPETYSTDNKNLFNGAFVFCQMLTVIIYLVWYYAGLKLFRIFEKGILFTAETVQCIQILGFVFLARFLLELGICLFFPLLQKIGAHEIVWSDLFTGPFIICIGWLIDEARKIREEQELTV
jgi:hypothetical protein